ncbi:hypothetical protein LVO79_08245 [Roseivivax marinus]|uniref:hypothetical protein n=1 Tax=Roseivivax marinus TaxID=1379903 RepID=UPI0008B43F41|nr:hypothetical protein [Roseivivax marinus]UMA66419.1 hypothetical protein LVO79_08245 [Roseivivax marinus]SEK78264.1 hypothetical protein SAMN05444413_103251 [Roseivivax marinus]
MTRTGTRDFTLVRAALLAALLGLGHVVTTLHESEGPDTLDETDLSVLSNPGAGTTV